jgi:hypothetical protein
VGWFVPPYVSVGLLETIAHRITQAQGNFTEDDLERVLGFIYTPDRLSSMVVSRYPQIPVVDLYQKTLRGGELGALLRVAPCCGRVERFRVPFDDLRYLDAPEPSRSSKPAKAAINLEEVRERIAIANKAASTN